MTRPSPAPDLSGIALEEWEKARRRLEVLKPLAEAERRSRGMPPGCCVMQSPSGSRPTICFCETAMSNWRGAATGAAVRIPI